MNHKTSPKNIDLDKTSSRMESNIVCSAVPPEIIEILELTELSDEVLKEKVTIIEKVPNGPSFFSSVEGNREDTSHIWFIINYRSLLQSKSRGSDEARKIIDFIQKFVKEDINSESNIEIDDTVFLSLEPVKNDMGHLSPGFFTYGFRIDYPGLEGVICYNLQGYKQNLQK